MSIRGNDRGEVILTCTLLLLAICIAIGTGKAAVGAMQTVRQQTAMAKVGDVRLLKPWMTIPYIAHTYHIPEKTLYDSLKIGNTSSEHRSTLSIIASHSKRPVDVIIHKVQLTITTYRQQHHHQPSPTVKPLVAHPTTKGAA